MAKDDARAAPGRGDGVERLAAVHATPVIGPALSAIICVAPLFAIFGAIKGAAALVGYTVDFEEDFLEVSLIATLPTLAWIHALENRAGAPLGVSVGGATLPYRWAVIAFGLLAAAAVARPLIGLVF